MLFESFYELNIMQEFLNLKKDIFHMHIFKKLL